MSAACVMPANSAHPLLPVLYRDMSAPEPIYDNREHVAPLIKLSVRLLDTYKKINELYYASRKRSDAGEDVEEEEEEAEESEDEDCSDNDEDDIHEVADGPSQWDDENHDYIVRVGEEWMDRYIIKARLGRGSFGQVVGALDQTEGREVAIKIIKNRRLFHKQALNEIRILEAVAQGDVENSSCVRLATHFEFRGHLCLVFERLGPNLYELLRRNKFEGLPIPVIRSMALQLLNALNYLGSPGVNVIHCDLKPENILLCDDTKARVEVIDFGSSCQAGDKIYTYIQSRFYRSPEVIMGAQYTMALDMWSLGCVLGELFLGLPLFNGSNETDQLNKMVEVLGMPSAHFIDTVAKAKNFFERHTGAYTMKPVPGKIYALPGTRPLEAIFRGEVSNRCKKGTDTADYDLLLNLVLQMLVYNPADRITPRQALQHPFFTSVAPHPLHPNLPLDVPATAPANQTAIVAPAAKPAAQNVKSATDAPLTRERARRQRADTVSAQVTTSMELRKSKRQKLMQVPGTPPEAMAIDESPVGQGTRGVGGSGKAKFGGEERRSLRRAAKERVQRAGEGRKVPQRRAKARS